MIANKINFYIAKNFFFKFLQVFIGFYLLIFFINLIDISEKINYSNKSIKLALYIAFLETPEFTNNLICSIVLIASIYSFFNLSTKNEITIIRNSNFSLWHIISPVIISSFILGIIWVTLFLPLSIKMIKTSQDIELSYLKKEKDRFFESQNGFWLKQENPENKEESLIINAKRIYQNNSELSKVSVWFFDKNGKFYKKIYTDEMHLSNKEWLVKKGIMNDKFSINKPIKNISIATDFNKDFITNKLVNNFQNAELFSFFELLQIIKDMDHSGLNSKKFKVYFHYLLNLPILFIGMTLFGAYFGIVHTRNNKSFLNLLIGTILGLIIYIFLNIIKSLGSSSIISIFASTWMVTVIYISVGIILINKKEIV
jgi:lipopolysaccharide export system permease protein